MQGWVLAAAALLAPAPGSATGTEPAPTIDDLAWLAGHWRGEGLGGQCEEIWSEPLGGTMMGSFRLVKDGQVEFYEILVLAPHEDGIAMKVKHFSREFRAWEDAEGAVVFRLESVSGQKASFAGLTLERDGDRLEVRLKMRSKDGTTRWESFSFERYVPGT